jgi:hypothetical protein
LANELSRIGDRLILARERTGNGAAAVWLPPPARREPTRRELPPDPPEKAKEPAAQPRPPATWVAIHVQLRHEHDSAASIFAALPEGLDEGEVYVDAAPVEADSEIRREAPRALPPHTRGDAFFVPRTLASDAGPTHNPGLLQYLAARALNAYLVQSSFASVEPRVLDVQA